MSGKDDSNSLSEFFDVSSESLGDGLKKVGAFTDRYDGYLTYAYLLLIMAFMAAVRLLPWDVFVQSDKVYMSGNDGWYHVRQSMYVTDHWPFTMPYDLLTGYPVGKDAGTFGSLFDQIVGTIALIVGLGDPTQNTVALIVTLTTVAFGVLCVIPLYYLTKEVASDGAGVLAAAVLALFPGLFLARSILGNGDHQSAEVFFLLVSLAAFAYAIKVAEENVLILETLTPDTIRDAMTELKYAGIAGLSMGAYLLTWTPGIIFFAAFGVFFALVATLSIYSDDHLSEPALIVGGVGLAIPGLLVLTRLETFGFEAAGYTLLQVLFPIGIAFGCWVLIGLQRFIEQNEMTPHTMPATIVASATTVTAFLYFALPSVFETLWFNLKRTLLLMSGSETRTIAEAQQFVTTNNFVQPLYSEYGMMFFIGIVGFILMSMYVFLRYQNGQNYTTQTMLLVFGIFATLMAFTQVRFNYYLAPFVALFAAYGVYQLLDLTGVSTTSIRNIKGYQLIVVLMVVIVFIPGLIYPVSGNVVSSSDSVQGVGSYTAWEGTLEWTANNTPDDGIDTYGTYQETDNPYADQTEGAYGVVSWWDYGHWISVTGERAPMSNPFQQHASESAEYLLATNESDAEQAVQDLNKDYDSNVEYVYVDWQMVNPNSKFTAPVTWHPDLNTSQMLTPVYTESGERLQTATLTREQRYYESLMVRLYHYHGSQANPGPVVVDWENTQVETQDGQASVRTFQLGPDTQAGIYKYNSMQAAQQHVKNDSSSQIGGVGLHPQEQVEALEHYRLVKTSEASAFQSRGYQAGVQRTAQFSRTEGENTAPLSYSDFTRDPSWVKMFQNVPGATVEGSGAPPNSTVTIVVPMQNPAQNSTFNYVQTAQTDANGNFEMTVPYSTTGYDNWGPENGHGNVEVKALDTAKIYTVQRSITQENGTAQLEQTYFATETHIEEGRVIGEDETSLQVTLEEMNQSEIQELFGAGSQTSGGQDSDTSGDQNSTGNETEANESG